jgi:uncharacterized protein (TIGR02099 family)
VVASAVLVGVARALTPVLNQYRDQISYFASQKLHVPVTIEKVSGTWHWLQPMIKLNDVKIMQPDTTNPLLEIQELDIGIDLFKSLFHWKPELGTILIKGSSLELAQQTNGQWQLKGIISSGKSQMNATAVMGWLLNLDRIGIKNINLAIIPQQYQTLHVSIADIDLLTFGNRHFIEGQFNLTGRSTVPIELSARMDGSANNFNKFVTHFHLLLQQVSLADWLADFPMKKITVTGNLASVNIHGQTKGSILKKLLVTLAGDHINIIHQPDKKTIPIDFITADMQMNHPHQQQWQLILKHWQLKRNGIMLPQNNAQINLQFMAKNNFIMDGNLNHLRLPDLQPLWKLQNPWSEKVAGMMNALQPHGELQQLNWHVVSKPNIAMTYSLQSNLNNLSWQAWQTIPGITNLNGTIQLDEQQGAAHLTGQNAIATFPLIFRQPITISNWASQVSWQHQNDGWLLHSSNTQFTVPAGQATSQLSLMFPSNNGSPVINLHSNVVINQLTKQDIYTYLPVGILSNQVVSWLDTNVLAMGQTHATLVLRGAVSDFPFDKNNGAFIIQSQFQDLKLQLSPGWPTATDLVGNMLFSGRSMDIHINDGHLSGTQIRQARAQIPYMGNDNPVILQIQGQAQGDAGQAITFLHDSPLSSYLQQGLNTAQASGPFTLNLALTIPLAQTGTQQPSVDGAVQLNGVTTHFPSWNVIINALNGMLQFNQHGLSAKNIQGQILGLPLTISIVPPSAQNKQQLQIKLSSILDMAVLQKQYNLPLDKLVSGKTPINGQIAITANNMINLSVNSDLVGIQVNLPAPLKKSAQQKLPLVIQGNITPKQLPKLSFKYGKQAAGLFQFNTQPNYAFNAGNITLGSNQLEKLPTSGLVVTGVFPVCSTAIWQNTLAQFKPLTTKTTVPKQWPTWLSGVALNCQQLIVSKFTFANAALNVSSVNSGYNISIQSPQAQGTIAIPAKNTPNPIQIQLQQLYLKTLNTPTTSSSNPINPATLPSVSFNIDDLRYDNRQFGQIKGTMQPKAQGTVINTTVNQGNALTAQLTAQWQNNPISTNLTGSMSSNDVSQALKNMGLPSNLKSQNAQANFALSWQGAPYQLSLSSLNGKANVQINDGLIVGLDKSTDAKVGFGRVLTMLSLQNLPARLRTGFSNLGQSGFNFTKLVGNFQLQNGNAVIQQANITSPIAAISATGSINLANQSYNMNMTVIPHVTSSVPIAATLVGGPLVGMVAWAADKVLSPAVNAITQYQYKITGTWENPTITKM